jgi:hypothetical protein
MQFGIGEDKLIREGPGFEDGSNCKGESSRDPIPGQKGQREVSGGVA